MNANYLSTFRNAGLVAGTLLLLCGARAADADAFPVFDNNYIKLSAYGSSFNEGSKAASQRRTQMPSMGAAGIEAFSYGKEVSKETSWQVDGKALGYAADYLAQFKVTKTEVGSFEAGYKRFRTFYDGAGGFFPTNNAFLPIYQRALYVDRGDFFVKGTVEMPKAPVFRFSYNNQTRNGRKDSTILGETSNTGIPIYSLGSLNPVTAARKIVPAYMDLGERQQTLQGSVQQTFGNTTATLTLVGTKIDNLNTRTVDRYPNELKPYPAIPANPPTLVPPPLANNSQRGFDQQGIEENGWSLIGRAETVVNENVTTYVGLSYHHTDGDLTAARLITGSLMTGGGLRELVGSFNPGGRPPYSYTADGNIKANIYTANAGVQIKATKDLFIDAGVKAEDYDAIAKSTASYVNNQVTAATGAVVPMNVTAPSNSRNSEKVWSPEASFRYTGIKTVSVFGEWDYRSSPGDESGTSGGMSVNTSAGTISQSIALFNDKVKEKHGNWKIGANWTPNAIFTARAEFFTKDHQNRFEGYGPSAGGYYVLDYDIWGTKVSATIRPIASLAFTTRYVTQMGDAAVTEDPYAKGDSNDSKRYLISETINWMPSKSFYMQGDVNVVYDSITTSYPRTTGLARNVVQNADNNYWNASVLAGFVVDKLTNATVQATYYKADNYNPALAAYTLPYAAGGKEYSISAGVTRKFSDRWIGDAKIGYFESRNDTLGGFANFHGPLAYVSVTHGF